MPKPEGFFNKIKWILWFYIIYPVFPTIRDNLVKVGILRHSYRQEWHIGWLAPEKNPTEFLEYLKNQGFSNHFIAWIDLDETHSLRKLDGFKYQYHLRLFKDNEIRGHYEKTPEAYPLKHFNEDTFEPRLHDFKNVLGDWVVYDNTLSHNIPATSLGVPYSG